MSMTGMTVFDDTIHTTNVWLKDLMERLHYEERGDAYRALRETLHALRDRLPVNAAVAFAAQLPMLVRGFYYEGWRPGGGPSDDHTAEEFVEHVAKAFQRVNGERDPREIVGAVFELLDEKISAGEISNVKSCLPAKIRALWPAKAA